MPIGDQLGQSIGLMSPHLLHPQLGSVEGHRVTQDLVQFRSLPYTQIPRRFARSTLLDHLPTSEISSNGGESVYDATIYGPCSVQPLDSIETDIRWNQLPSGPQREQSQEEDCMRITLTCPVAQWPDLVPVVVFVHGGPFMIGSRLYDRLKGN